MLHITKKAYILLETLISLMIISCMSIFTINSYHQIDISHYDFINEYLNNKLESYLNKKRIDMNEYNIYFNEHGNINMARTIHFNKHKVIIHLANGYITYE